MSDQPFDRTPQPTWSYPQTRLLPLLLALFTVLALTTLHSPPAYAADMTVDSTADTVADDGMCTLREAITNANNDDQSGSVDCAAGSGADIIAFSVDGTIMLGSTLPEVASEMVIMGAEQSVTVSGNNAVRVMVVNASATLYLNALIIANGFGDNTTANGDGGGIFNEGILNISNSTFSGNSAAAAGGGIANIGTATIRNSTFSDNSNYAIFHSGFDNATLIVINSTITDNNGGIVHTYQGLTLQNSIVANNGTDCYDASGSNGLTADSSNIDSDGTCANAATQTATQLNLGPLADNGGETHTIALLEGSTAIDAGDDSVCPAADQRGVARPQGIACDIGAYESESGSITIVKDAAPADGTDFTFSTDALTTGSYLLQWGGTGNGDGQLATPLGIAIDASGNLYVADANNDRIQKFDSNGAYLTQWGSSGSEDGQFDAPVNVAVDTAGNVYVSDASNNHIQKFDSNGTYLAQWGSSGSGDGQFDGLTDVAVDRAGNVYVVDESNHRIQKFDSNGTYLTQWGGLGSGDGQFDFPFGVVINATGSVYVTDSVNDRVQVFVSDTFSLDDAAPDDGDAVTNSHIISDLAPGNYTITEMVTAGWVLTDLTCDLGSHSVNGSSVTVHLSVGEAINCTFTNDIEVTNNLPVALNDGYSTDEGMQLDIAPPGVLDNDSDDDGDVLTAILVNDVANGMLTLNSDGSFTYMPNAGFIGDDSFTYLANDGTDDSNVATVTITVNAVATPFATCGGFDVFETAPSVYTAPSFAGNLIVGTDGYDWLIGTDGPDLMLGLGGPDDIWGKQGDDVICGGAGMDIIEGNRGNDTLYGNPQADWLIGGPGNDTLYGGLGWDDLEGNGGQDALYGEGGYDILLGGHNNDQLFGGNGPDDLYGNKGDDTLNGGDGNDFCKGGRGSDTIDACEGASAASVESAEAVELPNEEAIRRSNDGENGEHTIIERIQQNYLPMVTNN